MGYLDWNDTLPFSGAWDDDERPARKPSSRFTF
jgi:hypothetical protein